MSDTAGGQPRRIRAAGIACCLAALACVLAANARYEYSHAVSDLPRLTALHIADPRFAGSTFRFEGQVRSSRALPLGIVVIGLYDPAEDINVDVSVFPSLGSLPVVPSRGETVRVTGSLGMYRGAPQLKPLSAAHVEVLPAE